MISKIYKYASYPQTRLTLRKLFNEQKNINEKTLIDNANFLKDELAIRISKRVKQLDNFPSSISLLKNTSSIRNLYIRSSGKLIGLDKIENENDLLNFKDIIKNIKENHSNVADRLSTDLIYIRDDLKINEKNTINNFLNSFYNSRIGIRILIGQFVSICEHADGLFKPCYPYKILKNAIDDINIITSDFYDENININIHGSDGKQISIKSVSEIPLDISNTIYDYNFLYIPSFVYYIFFELLKNSVEATYINNQNDVNIYLSEGTDDIIVKISDSGGGMKKESIPELFSYCYSHRNKDEIIRSLECNRPIFSGYGHGLPLSKLYAQYFGGDVQMLTFNGIGTDTIIYLNKLLDNQEKIIW